MKRILAVLVFGCSYCWAQIPNPGFEQWTSGEPDGWLTNNAQGVVVPFTQSSTANSGTSALRGEVLDFMGFTYPIFILAGEDGEGFPVSERHANLTGYYQFSPDSGDQLLIGATMLQGGVLLGAGYVEIQGLASSYTAFSFPIEYFGEGNPDTCYIDITIIPAEGDTTIHVGSFMLIDDLAFSGITSVEQITQTVPEQFMLNQNYPNPFNPSTNFEFRIAESGMTTLKVFNMLGIEVATLLSQQLNAGTYRVPWNASGLPSGAYIYRLESGGLTQSKKLLLLK
ncbi:MAG: T9SS type A sorting domain-containing protein [Ignavibacteriae bacterium]|nr:T9SS type A sorting domain-containing protein [Ignavibacteriota bacterium]